MFYQLDVAQITLKQTQDKLHEMQSRGLRVVGVEVSDPRLHQCLDVNIDPQHSGGNSQLSAIKASLEGRLNGDTPVAFVTIRPDLDSLGAMAILAGMVDTTNDAIRRIEQIHRADCSRTDKWKPCNIFDETQTPGYEHSETLGAMHSAVSDHNIPLEERVRWVANWLVAGVEPDGYRGKWLKEREQIVSALESGETEVRVEESICVVKSSLRAATSIGYQYAPVLMCYNPEFRIRDGKPHLKLSICQYSEGYIDMPGLLAELQSREPGWGGSPTFIGSTQGESSLWSPQEVIDVMKKYVIGDETCLTQL